MRFFKKKFADFLIMQEICDEATVTENPPHVMCVVALPCEVVKSNYAKIALRAAVTPAVHNGRTS